MHFGDIYNLIVMRFARFQAEESIKGRPVPTRLRYWTYSSPKNRTRCFSSSDSQQRISQRGLTLNTSGEESTKDEDESNRGEYVAQEELGRDSPVEEANVGRVSRVPVEVRADTLIKTHA